jgi:hypothetical protein
VENILDLCIFELLNNDKEYTYRKALSVLSQKYSRVEKKYIIAKNTNVDSDILEATKIIVEASLQADILLKQSKFVKDATILTKIILKTLKIAQKILAGLLLKSPLKIGIAYNALHNVIKFLEKSMIKELK